MPSVDATVRGTGRPKNWKEVGGEKYELCVLKKQSMGLPQTAEDSDLDITLVVDGRVYQTKLRHRKAVPRLWVSERVKLEGKTLSLADVLAQAGFAKNEKVTLQVSGTRLTVLKQGATTGGTSPVPFAYPEELPPQTYVEGAKKTIVVNAYERSEKARAACLAAHGTACACCGMEFGKVYGSIAAGYIHVHHTKPLSGIGEEYEVDPVEHLRPICPNCHAVAHLRTSPFSIDKVKSMLVKQVGLRRTAGGE